MITLDLEKYCEDCPSFNEFSFKTDKPNGRADIVITCAGIEKCRRMAAHIRRYYIEEIIKGEEEC